MKLEVNQRDAWAPSRSGLRWVVQRVVWSDFAGIAYTFHRDGKGRVARFWLHKAAQAYAYALNTQQENKGRDNYTLTGNIRYTERKRLLRPERVVVEVEVRWPDGPDDFNGISTYLEGKNWKEATMEDLFNLKVLATKNQASSYTNSGETSCNEEQRQEVSRVVAWCLEGLHSRDYCFDIAVEHVCHSTTGDHQ